MRPMEREAETERLSLKAPGSKHPQSGADPGPSNSKATEGRRGPDQLQFGFCQPGRKEPRLGMSTYGSQSCLSLGGRVCSFPGQPWFLLWLWRD